MMKKFFTIFAAAILFAAFSLNLAVASAHEGSDLATDIAGGKNVWQQLQSKQIDCKTLTNEDYELLGEYFMNQMMGSSHASMNEMMEKMMGGENEENMHVIMGKRMSGCDENAGYSNQMMSAMPMMTMMTMMGGGNNNMWNGWNGGNFRGNGMMAGGNAWNGFGGMHWFGWLWMLLFWAVPVIALIALIKWLTAKKKN